MIGYSCTCGYVGFSDVDDTRAEEFDEDADIMQCARCGSPARHMNGWGKLQMSTEEKIQEFIKWVNFERPREDSKDT